MNDEARILRNRHAAIDDAFEASLGGGPSVGSGAMIAQTTVVTAYPTTAGVLYGIVPCDVDGAEVEGGACSYVPRVDALAFALNLGTQVPPVGTTIVCHAVGGRWCFRF